MSAAMKGSKGTAKPGSTKKRLVILGSGWSGYAVMQKVDRRFYDITMSVSLRPLSWPEVGTHGSMLTCAFGPEQSARPSTSPLLRSFPELRSVPTTSIASSSLSGLTPKSCVSSAGSGFRSRPSLTLAPTCRTTTKRTLMRSTSERRPSTAIRLCTLAAASANLIGASTSSRTRKSSRRFRTLGQSCTRSVTTSSSLP